MIRDHLPEELLRHLPGQVTRPVRRAVDELSEAVEVAAHMRDPRVLRTLGPSAARGLLLKRGKQGVPTLMHSGHQAHLDWTYPHDQPEMATLYRRAKAGQWDSDDLPWHIDVDPESPEVPLLPLSFFDVAVAERYAGKLSPAERQRFVHSMAAWMLSQFLHGEQGALLAAAQVTESVQFFDGKLYGATQVMDEARHVEVFLRYLESKLGRLYQVNDNLFTIIDALMTDARWDMKFLGMQIMVEGLALGAFSMLWEVTSEPLLKELLANVIRDEARHVHYGVVALQKHFREELSESERREREDWAFEVSLLMRNRFMMYEVYEEWFEHCMTRAQWRECVKAAPGLELFRTRMFSRLVPNLRDIGLLSERIMPAYASIGLMRYFDGAGVRELDAKGLLGI